MTSVLDADRLIAALPFRPVAGSTDRLIGYVPPKWHGPVLGTYNGFSGSCRVQAWELVTWLRHRRRLLLGPCCDLCGDANRLAGHSENYADIERLLTLCSRCHLSLHLRFRQPRRWSTTLNRLPEVPDWANLLSSEPIDLKRLLALSGLPVDPFHHLRLRYPADKSIGVADVLWSDPERARLLGARG